MKMAALCDNIIACFPFQDDVLLILPTRVFTHNISSRSFGSFPCPSPLVAVPPRLLFFIFPVSFFSSPLLRSSVVFSCVYLPFCTGRLKFLSRETFSINPLIDDKESTLFLAFVLRPGTRRSRAAFSCYCSEEPRERRTKRAKLDNIIFSESIQCESARERKWKK